MARARALHRLGVLLPQHRAAFYIGEEERQRAARQRRLVARRAGWPQRVGELGDERVRGGVARGLEETYEPGAAEVAAAHGGLGDDLNRTRLRR